MNAAARNRFIDAWGNMGTLWGINRSVARVHALLMASAQPMSLDEIAESLSISKGNASMSLRELRSFGVVRSVPVPGDRRDFYVTEPDVWTMFFRIAAERKRRELDPAIGAVRELLANPGIEASVKSRFEQLDELLVSIEGVAGRMLTNPEMARTALALLAGLPGGSGKTRRK